MIRSICVPDTFRQLSATVGKYALIERDYRQVVKSGAKLVSILGKTEIGSASSLRHFLRCGSALSVNGLARTGATSGATSVLAAVHPGSSPSLRRAVRLGESLSALGHGALGSSPSSLTFSRTGASISVIAASHLGSSPSLRSHARTGQAVSVTASSHFGSSLSLRSFAKSGSSLSVVDYVHSESSPSVRSFVPPFLLCASLKLLIQTLFSRYRTFARGAVSAKHHCAAGIGSESVAAR